MLCDYLGFRWRVIDWHAFSIADWSGVDYERDWPRTNVSIELHANRVS